MADIKTLVGELEGIRTKANTILDEHKDGVPAEKRSEIDALMKRAGELRAEIEAEQQIEQKRRDIAGLSDFLEKPQYKIPRGVGNGDADGRKALLTGGWEVKSGVIYAPTSQGKMVEMYPEDVLFGEMPTDKDAAEFFAVTRAAFQPEYRAAFMKFARGATKVRSESMAFAMLTAAEQKALTEGTDTAGGLLVPPDVQAEMLVRLPAQTVMRPRCTVVSTSRDKIVYPRFQPHATSGSIYTSAFVGSWAGETPAFAETDPAVGLFEVNIRKLRVATKLSNDLINDSAFNFLAFLASNGAENMALTEDSGFIDGNGGPLQPLGLLSGGFSTTDVSGTTADTISNTTADLGSATKIQDLEASLPTQYQRRAEWLMHRLTRNEIRQLVDAQNRFIWASGFEAARNELLGKNVAMSDFMPQQGTNANKVLAYGDFSTYIIAQRAQITITILRERFADTDQTGIILWERVGGAPWNTDAFRLGIV